MASSLKEKYNKTIKAKIKTEENLQNVMQVPKLLKVILNRGLGEAVTNPKALEISLKQFADISGQKPVLTRAKKSISNFKLREGQAIGCMVTLRGDKMYDFLTKFINICLPKVRDFRGIPTNGFDGGGNYSMGIKEDLIFPEINYDNVDKTRGMDLTIVTNTKSDKQAFTLLKMLGFPFRDDSN